MMKAKRYFPVFLDLSDADALVVGGGAVAWRKCRDLRAAGAKVRLVAPEFCTPLRRLKTVRRTQRPFRSADVKGAAVVVAATDQPEVNRRVTQAARRRGIPVNVVDQPDECTFIVPAVLRRGAITIAVSTGGAAPALAAAIRDRIAQTVDPSFAQHAAFLARIRPRLQRALPDPRQRAAFLKRLAGDDVRRLIAARGAQAAARLLPRLPTI